MTVKVAGEVIESDSCDDCRETRVSAAGEVWPATSSHAVTVKDDNSVEVLSSTEIIPGPARLNPKPAT